MTTTHKFVLAAALFAAFPAHAQTNKAQFDALYSSLNSGYAKNSYGTIKAWFDKNSSDSYFYVSKDKNKFKKDLFLKGLAEQVKQVKSVTESSMQVTKVALKGNKATVKVTGKFVGIVKFDGKELQMVDSSDSTDSWSKVGTKWKLDSSVVTREDVQLHQRKAGS